MPRLLMPVGRMLYLKHPIGSVSKRREAIIDVYNIILAVILAISPWLFAYSSQVMRQDAWISSAAVLVLAVLAIVAFSEWQEWASLAVGLWIIVSPWVLGFPHTPAMHVAIAVGCLVAYDAALELWLIRTHYSPDKS